MKPTELSAIVAYAPVDSCDNGIVHLIADHVTDHHIVYGPAGTYIDESGRALLAAVLDWAAERCQVGEAS